MLLAEIVATARAVASTPARNTKIDTLADLLRLLEPHEIEPAVGFLVGEARQGRIGIGWATVHKLTVEPGSSPVLTVTDVDRTLDAIARTTGSGSSAKRADHMTSLMARATGDEQDFIRRLLTAEIRQGALAGVMTEAVARAAAVPATKVRRAVMLSGDLGRTALLALGGGASALERVGLEVSRPIQPMLASSASDVAGALDGTGPASVEWKLDGIRIQVHRAGDDVRVFTRNLNDITARTPTIVEAVRALPVVDTVLDGEAIALDESQRPHLFQETMSSVGRTRAEPTLAMTPRFFDVLHLDGRDLIDLPLRERIAALEPIALGLRMPGIVTADPGDAQRFLDEALAAGHEGVMVKALDSTYQAGRRGKAWRKVKPVRTLDLVVLAAEWGHGRRRGWLSNLHLGARDPEGGFVMVGKTFKGLTDELLIWQTEQLLARQTAAEGITVRIRPELVVEIGLDGVQESSRYAGGVALRFARVLRYRPDKSPADADTITTVRAMLAGRP